MHVCCTNTKHTLQYTVPPQYPQCATHTITTHTITTHHHHHTPPSPHTSASHRDTARVAPSCITKTPASIESSLGLCYRVGTLHEGMVLVGRVYMVPHFPMKIFEQHMTLQVVCGVGVWGRGIWCQSPYALCLCNLKKAASPMHPNSIHQYYNTDTLPTHPPTHPPS